MQNDLSNKVRPKSGLNENNSESKEPANTGERDSDAEGDAHHTVDVDSGDLRGFAILRDRANRSTELGSRQ